MLCRLMDYKISVIIPVYKVEKCISKCIESIIGQTYSNWELLLIDDGSPDESGSICDKYATTDSRIKVFHIQNGGPSNARNNGLDNATGDYVCFVDADDWVESTYLEHLYAGLQIDGVGVVVGGHIREENNKIINRTVGNAFYHNKQFHRIFEEQRIVHWGYTVAKLYNLKTICNNGLRFPTNVRYCEDLIFFLEYWYYCDWIKFISEVDYHYMIVNNSNSLIVSYNSFESELEGYKRCKQCFEQLAIKYHASSDEIRHSFEWCSYMFMRTLKSMYRVGKNKLPFHSRYKRLKYIIDIKDVEFALRYPYYFGFDRFILSMMHLKFFFIVDVVLSIFFNLRYSKVLQPLVNSMIKSLK